MTEAELLEAARKGAVSLPTPEVQTIFPSGKAMRDWATTNRVKLAVHKGSVVLSASDVPASKTTVAEEVMSVGEKIKARL